MITPKKLTISGFWLMVTKFISKEDPPKKLEPWQILVIKDYARFTKQPWLR